MAGSRASSNVVATCSLSGGCRGSGGWLIWTNWEHEGVSQNTVGRNAWQARSDVPYIVENHIHHHFLYFCLIFLTRLQVP